MPASAPSDAAEHPLRHGRPYEMASRNPPLEQRVRKPIRSVEGQPGQPGDGLVAALDAGGRGVVVTGPPPSAATGGFVNLVRGSDDRAQGVSTVDLADSTLGRIAFVMAMVEQTRGAAGDYGGGDGVDSVIPNLSGG